MQCQNGKIIIQTKEKKKQMEGKTMKIYIKSVEAVEREREREVALEARKLLFVVCNKSNKLWGKFYTLVV